MASFDITVQDTTAPTLTGFNPLLFAPTEPFLLAADQSSFQLAWGPLDAEDSEPNLTVSCTVGKLVGSTPPYTFMYAFPVGDTSVTCTASDSNGNTASGTFTVKIIDEIAPVITLLGESPLTIPTSSDPYVDPGATAEDNADGDVSASISIDSSAVDTTMEGEYDVIISASDSSGNTAQLTRTVIVEFKYAGVTGIIANKLNVKTGSTNPLTWAWLDEDGNAVDSSADTQLLKIINCEKGNVILETAGDPGSSGFRFKNDNYWLFNWETASDAGERYCAVVTSSRSGQPQSSPPIRLR